MTDELRTDVVKNPEISKAIDDAKSIITTLLECIENGKPIAADEIKKLVKTAQKIFLDVIEQVA